jgi:hypothetical protein
MLGKDAGESRVSRHEYTESQINPAENLINYKRVIPKAEPKSALEPDTNLIAVPRLAQSHYALLLVIHVFRK